MNNNYRLYKYTNIINSKIYIGITRLSETQRAGKNGIKYRVCPAFWDGIQEFGWKNFIIENIKTGLTKEEAENLERKYILETKSNDPQYGYNIQAGGSRLYGTENQFFGKTHNKGTKRKIVRSNKQRVWTEEARQSVSEKIKGITRTGKKILCVETGIIYDKVSEAAKITKIGKTNIANAARDNKRSAGGFHWKYV